MKYEGKTNLTEFGIHKLLLQSTLGIVRTIRNLGGIFLHLKTRCLSLLSSPTGILPAWPLDRFYLELLPRSLPLK